MLPSENKPVKELVDECHVYENQIPKFKESVMSRGVPSKIIKFETIKQAQSAPSPATIFSLFYNEKFVTTDISICMDSRFDKLFEKESNRLL